MIRAAQNAPQATALPHNVELEQAMLGSVLIKNDLADIIALEPGDFHFQLHGDIYAAILGMRQAGRAAAPLTLKSEFDARADFKEVGGFEYLNRLVVDCPSVSCAPEYARALADLADRRRMIVAARESEDAIASAPLETDSLTLLEQAEQRLGAAIDRSRTTRRTQGAASIAKRVLDNITNRTPAHVTLTGIPSLDELTGGFRPGELHIVGARPGQGKSTLAGVIARNAGEDGDGVFLASLEMTGEQFVSRMLAEVALRQGAQISYSWIRKANLEPWQMEKLADAWRHLDSLPIEIDDRPALTVAQISSAARRAKRTHERAGRRLGLIIVDHIQKITADTSYRGNKVAETTAISGALAQMAKELDVPVLALSQLNRNVEGKERPDKRPTMADIRESGAIEQDAHGIYLLYRAEQYEKKKEPPRSSELWPDWAAKFKHVENKIEIIVEKNRDGETRTLELECLMKCGAIWERTR